jgi:hypothetical protein
MSKRVAVFVDDQNVYRRARDSFGLRTAPHFRGQWRVGKLITSRISGAGLEFVRVYRGLPDGSRDPKGHAACSRQVAAWRTNAGVQVVTRALRYPPTYPHEKASEKGIDVQLAIEFVTGALDDAFDIGVVFSADTDLKPALEMVCQRTPVKVEVATRQPAVGYASRISIPERKLWCHYLDRSAFDSVADDVDYAP